MSIEHGTFGHRLRGAYPRVLAFFRKRRPDAAEDLAQDVMLAAWRARHRFRDDASLDTYLFRICVRVESRARKRASGVFTVTVLAELPDIVESDSDALARVHVDGALATLDSGLREALELTYSEGLSRTEIAERLGLPAGTVASRLRRAQEALRDVLVPTGQHLDGAHRPEPTTK